jgi:hypothetical protein
VFSFFEKHIQIFFNGFSSYNKQWQDAQIAMADMLAVEIPTQPRAPENVCYDIIFRV